MKLNKRAGLVSLFALSAMLATGCKNNQPSEPNWADSVIAGCEQKLNGNFHGREAGHIDLYLELQCQAMQNNR
jgi:hypothetical protein